MAEYILKNKKRLIELLEKAELTDTAGLSSSSNTIELRNKIAEQLNSDSIYFQLCKFFILKHIYDYSGKTFERYSKAIKVNLKELLGRNPAYESVKVQRISGLKMPFKIWTKRTGIIQFSVIFAWLIFLILLHVKYPDLWIFPFHLPISGIAALALPGVLLIWISPRFFGQERFENIYTLEELVEQVYALNREKFKEDDFTMLNQEIKNFVDR